MTPPIPDHDAVFSPTTLMLGEIHWYLLNATKQMRELTTNQSPIPGMSASFSSMDRTAFGREVGKDEIGWWVFRKETDIGALQARTACALDAAQQIKTATAQLKGRSWDTYDDVLASVKGCIDGKATEVESILAYVHWLHSRNTLAPSILFAYRVWGSTRRGDRHHDVSASSPDAEGHEAIQLLAEIVLGLRERHGLCAWQKAWLETAGDVAAEWPEDSPMTDDDVPEAQVLARAAWSITDGLATYFEEFRDSLRNILIDIEKYHERDTLLSDEGFWQRFVLKTVMSQHVEPELWDFKELLRMWIAPGTDRIPAYVQFAEDVAAFANARGGVLVVGVTDRIPRQVVGIGNARQVEDRLHSAAAALEKHLEYPRPIFRLREVLVRPNPRSAAEARCLVVVVGQACEIVGVRRQDGSFTYPIRRQTGIERESRFDLSSAKSHMKNDNYDFLRELAQFVEAD